MIDDKKIEEAKESIFNKHFLNKNEDVVCIDHIAEPVYLDYQIKKAIELGAKWAISESLKDLWHPISEEPMRHSYILFKTANNNGFETEYIDCSWKTLARCFQITQWLYIDDLLPKEGGECK